MADGFWDDMEKSQKILKNSKALKNKLERYENLKNEYDDTLTMIDMAIEEDDEIEEELEGAFAKDLDSEFGDDDLDEDEEAIDIDDDFDDVNVDDDDIDDEDDEDDYADEDDDDLIQKKKDI